MHGGRMRVLFDCRMAEWTGVGRYTVSLARALARRDDIELVQLVMAGAEPPVGEAAAVMATGDVLSVRGAREFGRVVHEVGPSIVHCAQYPIPSPVPHPLIVTLHDLIPLRVSGSMPSSPKRAIYRAFNGRAVRHSDHIIVDSGATRDDVVALFSAPATKITPIPLAADDFAGGPIGALPVDVVSPYILCVSNSKPHKNVGVLIAAFAKLASDHPAHQLVLVGVSDPAFVAAHTDDTDVRSRVVTLGRVDDSTLRALYAGCETFVFPSRYEGFGLPPLEAMHFGAPVVSSNATSLPEVVGDAALLFDPEDVDALGNHLIRVAQTPALRVRLADASRTRAARFSWDRTAAATAEVYGRVLV